MVDSPHLGPNKKKDVLKYLQGWYLSVRRNRSTNEGEGRIYTHQTCATDSRAMKVVIDSVMDVVLLQALKSLKLT